MNTQKIRMSTKSTRGFTLVELIVVITILVILGTIAFMNMWSFSASARDSQRTSDLNQINSQIMTIQAKQGLTYSNMVVSGAVNQLTTPSIAGITATAGTNYYAGDVNYTVLGIDQTKFQDPTKEVAYKVGATSLAGTAYELAASLEEASKALVMGVYRPRAALDIAITMDGTDITKGTLDDVTDIGKLRVNDAVGVNGGANATTTIKSISADGTIITFTDDETSGTGITLAVESDGLIASYSSGAIAVTNNGTYLPYDIQ